MRGDLEKGAVQQVKVPGVEKKKRSQGKGGRKAWLADGERRRGRERAEAEQSAAAAPDCLAVVNGWMDRSHSSDENTASKSVIEFQPWSPPDGRSVGLDHLPRVQGTV